MLKKLSVSAAVAAFLATGALAQNTNTPPAEPTPPQATAPAPDAGAASTTTTQTTTTTSSNVEFKSSMAANEMLASKLTGMSVRNSAGEDLGDINDLVMDQSGKPSVAIIGVGGFLGLGEKNVGVPFAALTFADAQDGNKVARLDTTKESLKGAPSFVYRDDVSTTASTRPVPSQ